MPARPRRIRRRDREADAEQRDLMRPCMGKVFKQIQDDRQRKGRGRVRAERRAHAARQS